MNSLRRKQKMKWINVKDSLPTNLYDWCLVTSKRKGTNESWPITFARYDGNEWDFFYTDDTEIQCPVKSDYSSTMGIGEITHWLYLEEPIR